MQAGVECGCETRGGVGTDQSGGAGKDCEGKFIGGAPGRIVEAWERDGAGKGEETFELAARLRVDDAHTPVLKFGGGGDNAEGVEREVATFAIDTVGRDIEGPD